MHNRRNFLKTAALAGGALLGVLGALLAVPVAAGLLVRYEEEMVPRPDGAGPVRGPGRGLKKVVKSTTMSPSWNG